MGNINSANIPLIFGYFLIAIALIGGGIKFLDITIPAVGIFSRIFSFIVGCIILLVIYIPVTPEIDISKSYFIKSFCSGYFLDVYGANKEEYGNVVQAKKNPDQVWRLMPSKEHPGYYYIQSKVSDLYLYTRGKPEDIGGDVVQASKNSEQVWKLIQSDTDGYYYVKSYFSDLYLDVLGCNKDIGGDVVQAKKNPNQVWRFEAAPQ